MKTKRILWMFLALINVVAISAEDIIQVEPFHTHAGVVSDDAESFRIVMNNASADIWAFQFDILLPEGMEFDTAYDPFELNTDRYPFSKDRKGNIIYQHSIVYDNENQEGRWWRVIVHTDAADRMKESSGEVLTAYFTTAADMQPGIYPIKVRNALLVIDGSHGIYPTESSSYVVVGDAPQLAGSMADFSCLTGYVPSFVVDAMETDLAENANVTNLNLSGADILGHVPVLPNPNTMITAKEGSEVAAMPNAMTGSSCQMLILHDDAGAFAAETSISVQNASFDRQLPAEFWSTVCLPFALSTGQVADIKAKGVEIMCLISFSEADSQVNFESVESMEANRPYIVKSIKTQSPFDALGSVEVVPTAAKSNIITGSLSMCGTFEPLMLSSTEAVIYYAFNAETGEFVRVGNNVRVKPFRAYLALQGSSDIRALSLNTGTATGITPIVRTSEKHRIYDVSGRRALLPLERGIYIVDSQKVIK